ncbi:MAG TPA: tyrosine-type recombinase/integrase [Gemmatimonadales bacterium]|jgi:integrase|nr:tyrosine-type recombinase/integrase [Gemmatimonadales bacterium]
MPHRVSARGSFRIDRVFPGIGRVAVASGAKTVTEFRKRNDLVTRLAERGRLDLLRALRDGRIGLSELYAADRENRLGFITGDIILVRPLWEAVPAWVPESARAPETRRRYQVSFGALERSNILKPQAKIGDLEHVDWHKLERNWSGSAADWNHLRRAISRFLSMILGDVHHPFRRHVLSSFPLRREVGRVPDITPSLFRAVLLHIPEQFRPAYITLAATGLRVGEYLALTTEHLLPHTCSIRVPGTKTAASVDVIRVDERLWPWIKAAVPAPLAYGWLRIYWKRGCATEGAPDLRLHDLRHACGQWLTDAGRPEASVQRTLRHATPDMTRRYTMQRDRGEDARVMADLLSPKSA